jgi:uncharacterized YigZ family protein
MQTPDTYRTISSRSTGSFRDRASRFLAEAIPVGSEEDIRMELGKIRKKYHDANHHCYAYRLGNDPGNYRTHDDGEPSGSAGKPIYGQIQSKDLTNVLVVVTRYFGGTKLGIPGLINAYRTAAKESLDQAEIVTRTIDQSVMIEFPYASMNEVMRIIKETGAFIMSQDTDIICRLTLSARKRIILSLTGRLQRVPGLIFFSDRDRIKTS